MSSIQQSRSYKPEVEHEKETACRATMPDINGAHERTSKGVEEVQVKGPEAISQTKQAANQFQKEMGAKVDQAADEGKRDVDEVRAEGAGYARQVVETVTDVANAAQEYVSDGLDEHTPVDPDDVARAEYLQSLANDAYDEWKESQKAAQMPEDSEE